MVKKISNFTLIFCTILILGIIIAGYSFNKIYEIHNDRLIKSMEGNIKYYSKRCYIEEKCKNELTLKELYDNNYMKEVINPLTKEILDYNTKIIIDNNDIKIEYIK